MYPREATFLSKGGSNRGSAQWDDSVCRSGTGVSPVPAARAAPQPPNENPPFVASSISHSPADTFAHGRALAASLRAGDVIALDGELGAGKTQFVKGIAAGLGCAGDVTSPTFSSSTNTPADGAGSLIFTDRNEDEACGSASRYLARRRDRMVGRNSPRCWRETRVPAARGDGECARLTVAIYDCVAMTLDFARSVALLDGGRVRSTSRSFLIAATQHSVPLLSVARDLSNVRCMPSPRPRQATRGVASRLRRRWAVAWRWLKIVGKPASRCVVRFGAAPRDRLRGGARLLFHEGRSGICTEGRSSWSARPSALAALRLAVLPGAARPGAPCEISRPRAVTPRARAEGAHHREAKSSRSILRDPHITQPTRGKRFAREPDILGGSRGPGRAVFTAARVSTRCSAPCAFGFRVS